MTHRVVRSALAASLLACLLLPMTGCRGGIKGFLAKFHARRSKSKPNTTDYAGDLQAIVGSGKLSILKWPNYTNEQAAVKKFYDGRAYELAWTRDGRPTGAALTLVQVFQGAALKGLNPTDYDAALWPQRIARLEQIRRSSDDGDGAESFVAQFDVAMTIAAMRYASDLHLGRINPQSLNFDIDVPGRRAAFDVAGFVDGKLVDADAGGIGNAMNSLEPQSPMYQATEEALPRYLELAKQQSAQAQPPLPAVEKPVAKGGEYPAMAALWTRLQMEGEAAADAPAPRQYDAKAARAVRHYQERHGLYPDGKLSEVTIDSLNVPMKARVEQIDDALERWRWLPENFVQPRVLVNLPEFYVRAFDPDHTLAFKMKVVDGEAKGNHDTPMFVRSMRYMIFRPFWNLPVSIVKKELVEHLKKNAGAYLEKNDYIVTKGRGEPVTKWTIADLVQGRYMVRQKPGPKNSLGLVKFMFPNEYDVYMHSTPDMWIFNLSRRDRSHGCVRLNDAEKMADWVLDGQGDWDEDKIHEAMYGPTDGSQPEDNKQVGLKTTLPVTITYLTAVADEDGTLHFYDDLYGYDKQLEAALAKGRPYEQAPMKINPKLTPGETE
ncbi:MAG TPA: L,D-transpeptidase family protein [Acidobacteriaceae bacterium]|jgi:murein L,D-transpeptidase YcbB/YkuD|nr:L,D-transpeptidase family protein [Acidobacteriaceae bacterium]